MLRGYVEFVVARESGMGVRAANELACVGILNTGLNTVHAAIEHDAFDEK